MLLWFVIIYWLISVSIGLWAAGRVRNTSDFAVAGRHLPFYMVTATVFASMSVSIEVGNESISHGILAIGMECGLIEIWAIPLGEKSSADCAPRVLHSIPVQDCHIGVVKKLAWRPPQKDEKGLTLASCSTDHGVRFYQLNLSL